MDKHPFALLEFDKLVRIISGYSLSEASGKAVLEILPLAAKEEIEQRQRLIGEIMRMSHLGSPLKLSTFPDISRLIIKVRPEGAVLEPAELSGFLPVLSMSTEVSRQIAGADGLPELKELTCGLTGFPDLLRLLKRSIDGEGNILDGASPLLSELREKIRRLDTRLRKKLEEMVRDEHISVFLQDDFITKRSGRWVIPVRMDSKGQVAGVVHDVSKSGETAFVEPLAIISTANELENVVAEEKGEEIRILKHISAIIRKESQEIAGEYEIIVHLDLLNSIAKFAHAWRMEIPLISDSRALSLIKARHPLLLLAFKKTGESKEVVPLDVGLGNGKTIMVITGSNAGGKTIAVKTIGLLLMMALSGMPVPADSGSCFPLVENILVDIGDEQSIENNLSTFSAHVSNISAILKSATARSVVLVDELGTGTDPEEGAALACAVLKELGNSKALVFATTHLSDIKGFVHRSESMVNASMEFDRDKLTPLYRLRVGEPGQSHALETARRYGLPDSIIDSAKAMLGGVKVEFDNLIADLNGKREHYEKALAELEELRKDAESKLDKADRTLAEAEKRKKDTLADAYTEASELLRGTKKEIRDLMEDLRKREKAESREALREAKQKIEARQKDVEEVVKTYAAEEMETPSLEQLAEGDIVFARSLGYDASIIKINRKLKRVRVGTGNVEIELPLSDIGLKKGKSLSGKKGDATVEMPDKMPSSRINLVGLRVDEAMSRLEPFLNHASLAGLPEIVVIHGVGSGILARAVREHLEGHPLVAGFRVGDKGEGGAGVTIVAMA
jgi:DNA mismatch repair protein MutS2